MRQAFITGAAGFIGGYAVREFVAQGWRVFALVHRRTSRELEALADAGAVTVLRGDAGDPAALETPLRRALEQGGGRLDALVHCAGRASDVGRRREFRRANLESVRRLVALSKGLDAGRFVFVSTTDIYGLRDFCGEVEDDLPLRCTPRNPYPQFKIAAEEYVRNELPPERYSIVRPAAVWGVGDRTLTPRIVAFLRWSPWVIHFGNWGGRNRWPLAHVRNVAAALFLASTLPDAAGRAINVLDSERTSVDEFYRIVAQIYLPKKILRSVMLPLWVGKLFGAVVTSVSNLLNLDHPFADPSLYAAQTVSSNLDFSNARFLALCAQAGRPAVTRDEGIAELRAAASASAHPS